ncbi:hypothetical protein MARPO_0002s0317, partial [Marchantia polymorpha]
SQSSKSSLSPAFPHCISSLHCCQLTSFAEFITSNPRFDLASVVSSVNQSVSQHESLHQSEGTTAQTHSRLSSCEHHHRTSYARSHHRSLEAPLESCNVLEEAQTHPNKCHHLNHR